MDILVVVGRNDDLIDDTVLLWFNHNVDLVGRRWELSGRHNRRRGSGELGRRTGTSGSGARPVLSHWWLLCCKVHIRS